MSQKETLAQLEQFLKTASTQEAVDFIVELATKRPDITDDLIKAVQSAKHPH